MKRLLLMSLLPLVGGCFHGMTGEPGMMMRMGGGMNERREAPWPTVRIDEPAGSLVVMEAGVFGDGIRATAPLEGQFQPTARPMRAGYPLQFQFDSTAAKRYGHDKPLVIYARLNVNDAKKRHGILVLTPSECELRALVAGDLDEVVVRSEMLPTADQACRVHAHDAGDATGQHAASCPMQGDPYHGAAMHDNPHHPSSMAAQHGEHAGCGGGCGGDHGPAREHGCGGGHGHHGGLGMFFGPPQPGAMLTLRMTKF